MARSSPSTESEVPVLLAVTHSHPGASLLKRYVHGCHTVVVPDLEQAQDRAQALKAQVVVVDRADGAWEPLDAGEIARDWKVPTVVACSLPAERMLGQAKAVQGYLVKPVSRQALWDVLRRLGERIDRVLVVDDDRDFVRLLGRILDSPVRRYQVLSAYSGREGLDMVRQHQPDLVLLDLELPDMDGYEVVNSIRSDPACRQIPIVIVSVRDQIDYRASLHEGVVIARGDGMTPVEVASWVQKAMDATVSALPASPVPRPALAR
jgi:CheY-like chemotaxis protein